MLFVLMTIAGQRYAIDGAKVVEIIPAIDLLPSMRRGISVICGEFDYHGERVQVLDGGLMVAGEQAPKSLSTRIVIISLDNGGPYLGLLAAEMTETTRLDIDHEQLNAEAAQTVGDMVIKTSTENIAMSEMRILNPFYLYNLITDG